MKSNGKSSHSGWYKHTHMLFGAVFLAIIAPLVNIHAATVSGENSTDQTFTAANQWVYTGVTISGIPDNAVIQSITIEWNVDANYVSDVDWYCDKYTSGYGWWQSSTYTDMVKTGDDWLDGYSETSAQSRTITGIPSGVKVNGTWYFNIADTYNDSNPDWNKGRIDWWKITITYSVPPSAPGTPDLAAADDTGYSNTDNITYFTSGLTFSWGAASGAERYYYGWDTSTPSSTYTTSLSADVDAPSGNGYHTFYVRAWNAASGYGPASSLTVYIDRNRPSITNLDLRDSDDSGRYSNDNLTKTSPVRFTWTGNSNGGSGIYRYWYGWTSSANDASTANQYADVSPPSLNGTYTFYVGAEAISGLWAYYPTYTDQETVTWDTTPPAAPTPTAPSGDIGTLTPSITWTGNGSWKYQALVDYWNGVYWWEEWTSGETTGTSVSVQSGELAWQSQYRCAVKACDDAGNWSGWGTTVQFRPNDTTGPTTPGTPDLAAADDTGKSNIDNLTKNTSGLTFSWTASTDSGSGLAGYQWRLDSGSWNWIGNTTTVDISAGEGTHTFYVQARDNAGNYGGISSLSFIVDTTPPAAPTPTAPSGDVGSLTPNITWTANGSWQYQALIDYWNGLYWWEDWTSGETTGTSVSVPSGELAWESQYRCAVKACDDAGNWSGWGTTVQFRPHDTTAPSAPGAPDMNAGDDSGQSNIDNITNDSSIRFDWAAATDSGSGIKGYWWAIDDNTPETGGTWVTTPYCTGVNPSEGVHTIYVKAEDNAGNRGSASSLSFTIDRTPLSPPNFVTPTEGQFITSRTPTLDWQDVTGAWKYQVYVREDGLPYLDSRTSPEVTTSQWTVSPELGVKAWGWQVKVWDIAGNESSYGRNGTDGAWGHFTIGVFITSISPDKASAGTDTSVTISGANFGANQGTGKVEFFYKSGEPKIQASIVSWSDTQIVCKVPVAIVNNYQASASSGPVTVSTAAGTSNPYEFRVSFGAGSARWPGSNPSVNYYVNENTADCTGEAMAVQRAAGTWNSAGAMFTFRYSGTTTVTVSSRNNTNEILWANNLPQGVIAATYSWSWDADGIISERDIVFNDDNTYFTWSTSSSPPSGTLDVETIALHELGHCLSLRDLYGNVLDGTNDVTKVMYGFGDVQRTKRNLHPDDVAGIRWIYGQAPSLTATVWDAWWSNAVDSDGDGYKRSARLNWDPDVSGGTGSLTVYEKIYWKQKNSSTWNLLATTAEHTITDTATSDSQYRDVVGGNHDEYDWKIEVYRSGNATADYTRDPSNDTDLDNYPMETALEDTPSAIGVTPASQDFGSIQVGSTADRTFSVQNTGGGTLSGTATVSAPFSIVSGGTYSLGAGASQTVTVRYSPSSAGSHNQNVSFTGGGGATRPVSGSAYNPPAISVTPASHDFGSIQVGTTADRTFSVQNTGGGTLSGTATVSAPFSVVSGGTYSLGAGASQTVTVRYTPTGVGSHNQNVSFTGGGGATRPVSGSAFGASYTISGYVRTVGGTGISGITLIGLPGPPATDSSGFYTAAVSNGWSGSVSPSMSGYAFNPSSRSYTSVGSNQSSQNFTGYGSGDSDGDGVSDWAEFTAGTDAMNPSSALRITGLVKAGSGSVTVSWQSVPGKTYKVLYADSPGGPWLEDLPGSQVTAGAGETTKSYTDTTVGAASKRFYRVRVVVP